MVAELYRATEVAAAHVAELTALTEPPVTALTRVVDRAGWIDVNVGGMRRVMAPIIDKLSEANTLGRVGEAVGGRVTGVQAGAVIGFLSGKVLGQFEFFDRPAGSCMLVAPNLVAVERQLDVDPSDFRLWVCLHEVTHRVQFTAVPWMRQHMLDEVQALSDTVDTDPDALRQRVSDALGELAKVAARAGRRRRRGLISVLATPEQRAVLDRVTAFMSVVEGHAEYVMNAVSPTVIPTQPVIEARFAQRRQRRQPARPAAAQAARPRRQDPPVRRRVGVRARGRRPGRARRLQRHLDGPRRPCRPRPRSPTRPPGSTASTADTAPMSGPHPAVAAIRRAVRESPARPTARCSSPARAAPTRSRWPPRWPSRRRGPGSRPAWSPSTTACSPDRPSRRAGSPRSATSSASTRCT